VVLRVLVTPVLLVLLRVLRVLGGVTSRLAATGRQVAGQAQQVRDRQRRRVGERGPCRDAGTRECHGADDTDAPDESGNHG
jgi:hypothetical protein